VHGHADVAPPLSLSMCSLSCGLWTCELRALDALRDADERPHHAVRVLLRAGTTPHSCTQRGLAGRHTHVQLYDFHETSLYKKSHRRIAFRLICV
jgi:hypothetical protein